MSSVLHLGLSVGCVAAGAAAALTTTYELLIPSVIMAIMSLVVWFTRVKTRVTSNDVTFRQLGKTIVVPIDTVHMCAAQTDRLGLGAGLRWLGPGQWAMLSGGPYVEILYGDGKNLLASHRDAPDLCRRLAP